MTLTEFYNQFFGVPTKGDPTTLYIFGSEGSADSWMEDTFFGGDNKDYEIIGVVKSDMKMEYTFKPELCEAKVLCFFALAMDTMAVVIEEWK